MDRRGRDGGGVNKLGLKIILCITFFSYNLLTGAESPVSEKRERINNTEYNETLKYKTTFLRKPPCCPLNGVRIAALNEASALAYYLTDQVDSVSTVLDDDGNTLSLMQYLPYGETFVQRGDLNFSPKFNSQELDRESGFYFFNARFYDPGIARFTSADSVIDGEFDTQGWNRFSYVKGNPIGAKDPTGHLIAVSEKTETKNNVSKTNYEIKFTGTLVNSSSEKLSNKELKDISNRMKDQIQKSFSGKEGNVSWKAKVDINTAKPGDKIKDNRHKIELVDEIKSPYSQYDKIAGKADQVGGKEMKVRSDIAKNKTPTKYQNSFERTATHEFGHLAGLEHPKDSKIESETIMHQSTTSDNLTVKQSQIKLMADKFKSGSLNQGLNVK